LIETLDETPQLEAYSLEGHVLEGYTLEAEAYTLEAYALGTAHFSEGTFVVEGTFVPQ
jgi:hypothetical protein